jgi:thiol-disulfide isomerase/thioredoxin/tetratricopeptide (TPR) repeat protein
MQGDIPLYFNELRLRGRAPRSLLVRLLLLPLFLLAVLAPTAAATAASKPKPRPATAKQEARLLERDRALTETVQLRDRGELDAALLRVQALLADDGTDIAAHRLYQEIAGHRRRSVRLVEAEYRHWLDASPDEPARILLHASALMSSMFVGQQAADVTWARAAMREVLREVAAAEADPGMEPWSHLLSFELQILLDNETEAEAEIRAAAETAPSNLEIASQYVFFMATRKRWDLAVPRCLELIARAPWRLGACQPVFPLTRGGEAAPDDQQSLVADALAALERSHAQDRLVLSALHALYEAADQQREADRIARSLATLDSGWRPPLQRSPYLRPLPGGELQPAEMAFLKRLEEVNERSGSTPKERAQQLAGLESELPEAARIRALYWRQRAVALRNPLVADPDGSRDAARKALDYAPDDPHAMNEWAYMAALDKVELGEALKAADKALELLLGEPFDPMDIDAGDHFGGWEGERSGSVGAVIDTRGWVLYQLGRHSDAVRDLELASLLTRDGTVQGHLGRARYATGNDSGAFANLLRALALGTEDEDEVTTLAKHLYDKLHVVPGGLDALVAETRRAILEEEGGLDGLPGMEPEEEGEGVDGGDEGTGGHGALDFPGGLGDPSAASRVHPLIGRSAPQFEVTTIAGKQWNIEDLRGRVLVVDFWATWCGPCREVLPVLESISLAMKSEPVTFLALSMDDGEQVVREFWSRIPTSMEVAMAPEELADQFSVDGIPATFLIGKDGKVAAHHAGFSSEMAEELTRELVMLLAE